MYKFHNRRFLPYPFHHKYYMSEVGLQEESLSHLHPPNNKCKSDHAGCHPVHQPISLQARAWYGIHEVTTMCHPVRDFPDPSHPFECKKMVIYVLIVLPIWG
jgi:hypothetical protein